MNSKTKQVIATTLLALVPVIWLLTLWQPKGDKCLQKKQDKLQLEGVIVGTQMGQIDLQTQEIIAGMGLAPNQTATVQEYFRKISNNNHFVLSGLLPCMFIAGIHGIRFQSQVDDLSGEIIRLSPSDQPADATLIISKRNREIVLSIKSAGKMSESLITLFETLPSEYVRFAWDRLRLLFGTLQHKMDLVVDLQLPMYIFFATPRSTTLVTFEFSGKLEDVFDTI